jgi:uncharacterized protein involved in outer membrane biogenesis
MKKAKTISILSGALLTTSVLVAIVVAALMIAEVSISLDRLRQPLENSISESTGRNVSIDGELRLTLSIFPALTAKEIHIYNDAGWHSDEILSLNEARLELALMPLLDGELLLKELSAEHAVINLEQDVEGHNNWTSSKTQAVPSSTRQEPDSAEQPSGDRTPSHRYFKDRINFGRIRLNNMTLNYRDDITQLSLTDQIEEFHVNMYEKSRLEADLSGIINGIPYTFTATSDLLRNIPDDKPWKLDLQGDIAGSPLSLNANIQITDGIIHGQLGMQTSGLSAGRLLEPLGLVKGLNFRASQMNLQADLEGGSLSDLIRKSSVNVTLSEGTWKLGSHVDKRFTDITFEKATVSVIPGKDLGLEFAGIIGGKPIQLSMQTNPPADFVAGLDEIKLALVVNFAGAKVNLDGTIKVPVSSKTLAMSFTASGESLNQWDGILISDLPPYGPYQLSGHLSLTPNGYHVRDFKSTIANSDLRGSVMIDMTSARPVWKMDLLSNQLQLNDFDVEGYTLIPVTETENLANEKAEKGAKENKRELSVKVDQRLAETHEIDRWDIDMTVESRNTRLGKDRLGDGKIVIRSRPDSFDMDVQLNTLGGRISSDMGFRLVDDGVAGHLNLDMDNIDYGIFLRSMDPETESGGLVSTRVNLRLAGNNFMRRFERANGSIDFALWPQRISAGDIDIWAVDVFEAVSSSVTTTESKINCVVGILDIEEGKLSEEFLAVDTTKVWLSGNLDVNYPGETIELGLFPHPKKPKIGGIETPVYLKGSLNDNFDTSDLRVKTDEKVKTFFSLVFSPLHAPMRRIFGKKVPEDGSEMCGKLLDRKYLQAIKDKKGQRNSN